MFISFLGMSITSFAGFEAKYGKHIGYNDVFYTLQLQSISLLFLKA